MERKCRKDLDAEIGEISGRGGVTIYLGRSGLRLSH